MAAGSHRSRIGEGSCGLGHPDGLWCCRTRAPKDGVANPVFRPWRAGARALPAARPYRSPRFGGVWQLCLCATPDAAFGRYAFHQATHNSNRQEVAAIEGPHLSYGAGTFRGDRRYDDPFSETYVDYEPAADNNVYIPLGIFGAGESGRFLVAVVEGRDMLADLVSGRQLPAPKRASLYLIGKRQGGVFDLKTSIDIRGLHQMSSIVYGERLFVYANYESRIFSWRIVP